MSNPKKAASNEQGSRCIHCVRIGFLEQPVHKPVNLTPLPVNGVKEKQWSSERGWPRGPSGDGYLEVFSTVTYKGK